jgi:DNA-binding GntR family transcriptional regulator
MASTSWPQIPANTLADQVYRTVRDRILEGQIPPGDFIRETDLNTAMGVSRTPVREALGRLASEGFLEKIPHRGFRVPDEPVEDLLELYPIVAALDLLAGRLALPRLTSGDINQLKQINTQLRQVRDKDNVPALIELNNRFHRVFSLRSGNRRLCSQLDDLRMQLARLETWYYSSHEHTERSIHEHAGIIEAIERRDYAKALALFENNMYSTYLSFRKEIKLANNKDSRDSTFASEQT